MFVPVEPSWWVSWAVRERLGWFQFESTTGKASSPQSCSTALGALSFQPSWV